MEYFLALGLGLTGPTEDQKVQKLIRHHIEGKYSLHLKLYKIWQGGDLVLARNLANFTEFLAKTKSSGLNSTKFQKWAKITFNMVPDQFLNFLDLCGPS